MEEEFNLFSDLTEADQAQAQKNIEVWKARVIDISSLDGRRKKFLRTFIHLAPAFEVAVFKVKALLSTHECETILRNYSKKEWSTNRHSAFPTTDVSLTKNIEIVAIVNDRIIPLLAMKYGFENEDLEILDVFLVKYSAAGQTGLAAHTDGCLLSFNILLNERIEFGGGGTYFPKFKKNVEINTGDCLIHPGKIEHCGNPINSGNRFLLVGFVETKREGVFSKRHMINRI
jgi:hypothetical protein